MILASGIIGGINIKAVSGNDDASLSKASDLTSIADGTTGTVSFWVKSSFSGAFRLIDTTLGRFRVTVNTGGAITIIGLRPTGSICLNLQSSSSISTSNWTHVLASWDLSADATCNLYTNGANNTSLVTRTNANIDYTQGDWYVGRFNTPATTGRLVGELAEVVFDDSYLDITSSAVRETFAKNGKPVRLGDDGSIPFGFAPKLYLHGPGSTFATNYGSGGDFTASGTFGDALTRPSY